MLDVYRECRIRGLGSGDFREEGISGQDQDGGSDEVRSMNEGICLGQDGKGGKGRGDVVGSSGHGVWLAVDDALAVAESVVLGC